MTNQEIQGAIKKTIGGHLRAGLEEMKKVFGRNKNTKKIKPNQIGPDHEKWENHIIKKKKEKLKESK